MAGQTLLAKLRGMSPNQVLVLVNGKRRHTTANISIDTDQQDGSPFSGGAGVDLNFIPVEAIDHIEVLTDGAARNTVPTRSRASSTSSSRRAPRASRSTAPMATISTVAATREMLRPTRALSRRTAVISTSPARYSITVTATRAPPIRARSPTSVPTRTPT
jgi:hypothetical protein